MLNKLAHFNNLVDPEDQLSSNIMDLSRKITSNDSWNFENFLALKLPQISHNLQHNSNTTTTTTNDNNNINNINGNNNNNSSGNRGSQQLSAKSLAYCTPNPVPNLPENNQVHFLDYRGAHLAAFTVNGRDLICLPQAFELFLKHLVGGLHTVYTKLKRLEIIPVVCNVEQVRILRGLGAIQPGVNRCKLIAPQEFDVLYADCTNSSSRPGRPSKRLAGIETPVLPSIHDSCHSNNFVEKDTEESNPKQSRTCSTESDNSSNDQQQTDPMPWLNFYSNLSTYPLLTPPTFNSSMLSKSKLLGHLESLYSSFMKYALSAYQSRLEHENNSPGSAGFKSIYDKQSTENLVFPLADIPWLVTSSMTTNGDQRLGDGLTREPTQNSPREPRPLEDNNQSDYQQLFDSKVQHFLNQFVEMNYQWKSNQSTTNPSTSLPNIFDSQTKEQRLSEHLRHHAFSELNTNTTGSVQYHGSRPLAPTNFSSESFKQLTQSISPTISTTNYHNTNDAGFLNESLIAKTVMPFEESIKDLKPNKWPTLNFSVEQMKTDLKESATDENSDDEIDADSSGKKHNTFSSSLLNDTYQTINSNDDDDDDDGDSDGDNTDEVNRTTSNTDISKTLAVLNYYYWWLQYMSNEFSHPNQSTNQTMGNLGSSNFSSNGNYTNDD